MGLFFNQKRKSKPVEFEQVLLDATHISSYDQTRFSGRLELPLAKKSIYLIASIFFVVASSLIYAIFSLQVIEGASLKAASESNSTVQGQLIAERGVIYDRYGTPLAWNEFDVDNEYTFPTRSYIDAMGVGQLLGYVSYPMKDSNGLYWRDEYLGRNGVEGVYNAVLSGDNGRQIIEVDALGEEITRHKISPPTPGDSITLSVDVELSQAMYEIIATSSAKAGFRSGAGVVMDIHTGEIVAMTSFPSYDPQVMADGEPSDIIQQWNEDDQSPFLNKVLGGVYTPGSVVKPFLAYGALVEGVVSPDTEFTSTGSISIPNPYSPGNPTIFRDWRDHGKMNLKEAIAFSSNVYMYYISGGHEDQEGIGVNKMFDYFKLFGFGEKTGINLENEQTGLVPNPNWKERALDEAWRLGDTYNTAIGQFGWQATPLQLVRAYAAIANGGSLVTPHVEKGKRGAVQDLNLDAEALRAVREGMRMAVNYDGGTARSLERSDVAIAAKSGTAQIGVGNQYVNSWAAGYFPVDNPRYAFTLLMEKAPADNTLGATTIMGQVFDWMAESSAKYFPSE